MIEWVCEASGTAGIPHIRTVFASSLLLLPPISFPFFCILSFSQLALSIGIQPPLNSHKKFSPANSPLRFPSPLTCCWRLADFPRSFRSALHLDLRFRHRAPGPRFILSPSQLTFELRRASFGPRGSCFSLPSLSVHPRQLYFSFCLGRAEHLPPSFSRFFLPLTRGTLLEYPHNPPLWRFCSPSLRAWPGFFLRRLSTFDHSRSVLYSLIISAPCLFTTPSLSPSLALAAYSRLWYVFWSSRFPRRDVSH